MRAFGLFGLLFAGLTAVAGPTLIDLSKAVNMGFRDEVDGDKKGGWTDQGGNDFRTMPVGRQTLCGVPFTILDPAKNNGKGCLVLNGAGRDYFAGEATATVNASGGAIAFLHTLAWGDRDPVATYVVTYADGKTLDVPIRQGKEIVGWWGTPETDNVKVAIIGKNLAARKVSVQAWVWTNPRPGKVIESITFRSTGSKGIPIIVAATVLDKPVALKSELPPRPELPLPGFTMIEAESFKSFNVPPSKEPNDEDKAGLGKKVYDTWPDPKFSGGHLFEIKPPAAQRLQMDAKPQWLKDKELRLEYEFDADKDATYTFWARIGPANNYSEFLWRVDDGEPGTITYDNPFLDMWDISFWVTLGWVKLGEHELKAGRHILHIVVPKPGKGTAAAAMNSLENDLEEELGLGGIDEKKGSKGKGKEKKKQRRWGVMADCFAVSRIPFQPCGTLQAGEKFNTVKWLDEPARNAALDFSSETLKSDGARDIFELDGLWEMARDQEPIPSPHLDDEKKLRGPLTEMPDPKTLSWLGVRIPHLGDKRDLLSMLHRRWYRKFVALPKDLDGKRVKLHFGESNYTTSVFVNGNLCGTHFGGYVPFSIDITDALEPGKSNEIMVGVKGLGYYRREYRPEVPWYFKQGFSRQMLVPGRTGWHKANPDGIAGSVWIETQGAVNANYLFVQSKFADRKIVCSAEVSNNTGAAFTGKVSYAVTDRQGGEVSAVGEAQLSLAPGETKEVSVTGSAAKLTPWFPGKPHLYQIRVVIRDANGKPVDVAQDTFGYREITLDGRFIRINGKRMNFRSVITGKGATIEDVVGHWREYNCNTIRLPHSGWNRHFKKDPQRSTLCYCDENGIMVRFNSQINGMFIDLATNSDEFWQNATDYLVKFTKAYRNHPSVIIWTSENELDLISNMANHKWFKEKQWKMMTASKRVDPTRPVMGDGAGDLLGKCEMCNWHYCEVGPIVDPNDLRSMQEGAGLGQGAVYPDNAYTLERVASKCVRRPWDRKRPLWVGETYFYSGKVKWQGWIGGDEALSGRLAANVASARFINMLVRGYRWADVAGFNMFVSFDRIPGEKIKRSLAPIAVFAREYNRNFYTGQSIKRTVRVFNDTLDPGPIRFEWALTSRGKTLDQGSSTHRLAAGFSKELGIEVKVPAGITQRAEAELVFRLLRLGKEVFSERTPVALHPPVATIANPAELDIWLYDPKEVLAPWLRKRGVAPQQLARLSAVKDKSGLLIVGPHAVSGRADGALRFAAAFAGAGGRVLVLEQKKPVPGSALPVPVRTAAAASSFAYPRGAHPALNGIRERDLCCWAADHVVFEGSYQRTPHWPVIVEASSKDGMNLAPVVELGWGRGHYILSQLRLQPNLNREPIADRILRNFIAYLLAKPRRPARLAMMPSKNGGEELVLKDYKLKWKKIDRGLGFEMAIEGNYTDADVIMLPGTKKAVGALAGSKQGLQAFGERGGWVLINGLAGNAHGALSKTVGESLIVRPVGQERITVAAKSDPLMAGIGNHDFYREPNLTREQLLESKFLHGDAPLSSGVFSGAVVYRDVCPLTRFESLYNGLTSEDHWKYIAYRGRDPLTLNFRRPFTISRVVLRENRHYNWMQEIALTLGNDKKPTLVKQIPAVRRAITYEFKPRKVSSITLTPTKIKQLKGGPTGWDIVEIHRVLPESFTRRVVPLTRPAGIVKFPIGRGGIILNLLPLNHPMSQRVLLQLLQNLGVPRDEKKQAGGLLGDDDDGALNLDDLE